MANGYNKKNLCKLCKQRKTSKGHDPCIADLPGVLYACCGHGIENGYIKFIDGRVLHFTIRKVELTKPQHKIVRPSVPIRIDDELYPVLDFKKRKVQIEKADYNWSDQRDGSILE